MRSYLLSGACAASMLLALTPIAHAADFDIAPEPHGWGWYISVFGGLSLPDNMELSWSDGITAYDAEIELDDGFMAGIAVGAQFNDWVRGEIELSGHRHGVDESLSFSFYYSAGTYGYGSWTAEAEGDVNALFVLANLWVELPLGDIVRPYAGGGVGVGRLDADIAMTDSGYDYTFLDESDWGFAFQLGAGAAFDITPNIVLDVGYRFKGINAEFDLDDEDNYFLPPVDEPDADYRSHNVILGLRWRL
jgi:opacity protein-like surface antigen